MFRVMGDQDQKQDEATKQPLKTLDSGAQVWLCASGSGRKVIVTPSQLRVNGGATRWYEVGAEPKGDREALTASTYVEPAEAGSGDKAQAHAPGDEGSTPRRRASDQQ